MISARHGGRLGKLREYYAIHELMKGTLSDRISPAHHVMRTCKTCGKEFKVFMYRGRCGWKTVHFDTLECAVRWYYHKQPREVIV